MLEYTFVIAMAAYGLNVSSKIECFLSTDSPKIVPKSFDVVLKSRIEDNWFLNIRVMMYSSTRDLV